MDNYRKGWALRYLREAKAELAIAETSPNAVAIFTLDAMRKAQAAIYNSLGDLYLVEGIVQQEILEGNPLEEPILRCLVEIEKSIRQFESSSDLPSETSFRMAEGIVNLASDIVNLFLKEDED